MTTLISTLLRRLGYSTHLIAMWDRYPSASVIINIPVDLSTPEGRTKALRMLGGVLP
jgi:hypothetical protein